MGLILDAVEGKAGQRREDIGIRHPADVAQKSADDRRDQLIGKQPADDTADEHQRVTADGEVPDAGFLRNGVNDDGADAQRNARGDLIDGVHQRVFRAAQKEFDIEILDVAALEVIYDTAYEGDDRQKNVVFVGKQRFHLIPQRNLVLMVDANLRSHILRDTLTGIEVFQKQKRDRYDGKRHHQDRITVDVLFQPHRQGNHIDQHADDDAGDQGPAQLPGKLRSGFVCGVPRGQRADVVPEQIEEGGAHRVIGDQQEEEIIPVALSQRRTGEQEDQSTDDDGDEAEDQIPGTHAALAGLRMLQQPAVQKTKGYRQHLGEGHDPLITAAHELDHFHVRHAVHCAGLLREEFFHQRGNGVYNENKAQWSDQVTENDLLL